MVYLAYAFEFYEYPEMIGVFATKAAAYRAARKRMFEMIVSSWDLWRGTQFGNDNHFGWRVVTHEVRAA